MLSVIARTHLCAPSMKCRLLPAYAGRGAGYGNNTSHVGEGGFHAVYLGWVLGGALLARGLVSLVWNGKLMRSVNASVGRKLPQPMAKTLRKISEANQRYHQSHRHQ